MKYLIEFSEASQRAQAGGKGYGLQQLTGWGFNVPPGLVLTTSAYDEAIASPEISQMISSGDAAAVRAAISNHAVETALADEIAQAWQQMSDSYGSDLRVSCRSSATAEDSAAASFAGQFATVLGVAGPENVLDAIKRCWASVWSNEALSYHASAGRASAGIANDEVSMAVVIQQMVRADASGVAFSVNPVTGADTEVMVNSNWGLGETVVSGLVSPDMFLVQKSDLQISLREISQSKTVRHVVAAGGSVEEQTVPFVDATRPSLTDEQVTEIARMAVLAEQKAGSPQDIEWAYEADTLYMLQTRPVTTV